MPRGTDFEARWTEGFWAEQRITDALNAERNLLAVQFGITDGTAFRSSREMQSRDLPVQNTYGKRPDILNFQRDTLSGQELDAAKQLVTMSDDDAEPLVERALLAIESEFSPYDYAHRLTEYGKELSFTVKEEDLEPLCIWADHFPVPLGIVQVYTESAFFLSLDALRAGIADGSIKRKIEGSYNKPVYYPKMSSGFPFATFKAKPTVGAVVILDKYGKYTPVRKVEGGELELSPEMRALVEGT